MGKCWHLLINDMSEVNAGDFNVLDPAIVKVARSDRP